MPHTQGPWYFHGREIFGDGGSISFATVFEPSHGLTEQEQRANARLIAAAPELLAALKEVDPHNPRRSDCNERACGNCSTCRARAAIAKAEGK